MKVSHAGILCAIVLILLSGMVVFVFKPKPDTTSGITSPSSHGTQSPTLMPPDIASFVPAGWSVIDRTEGDLNGDHATDIAFVIEKRDSATPSPDTVNPRRLVILLHDAKGGYTVSATSDRAILLADEGGIYGDPFSPMSIERGSLLLNFYGGSAWRWSETYQFRYQQGGWYLIGKTVINFWNGAPDKVIKTESYNYLTGKELITAGSGWSDDFNPPANLETLPERDTETWVDLKDSPLLNLKDFTAGAD